MIPGSIAHLNGLHLSLLSLLVVFLFEARLIKEILLLRARGYLIDKLLLGLRVGRDLFVIKVQPTQVVLVLFKGLLTSSIVDS